MGAVPKPRVTVITPAYNVEKYIVEAIDSVLAQTFRDFEYIVVDDGSTDETVAQITPRLKDDARLRLIRGHRGGAASARNVAIKQASGEFIAFLDGDDRWHPRFLEKQLRTLESLAQDFAAVFARSRVMADNGRVYLLRWQRSGSYDFEDMLVKSCPPRVGSSLLIKRSAFELVGLFDESLPSAQDLDMWIRIQRDSGMPYFWGCSSYLLDIRVRPGAISRDHRRRFESLDRLLAEYAPKLRHYPAAAAYLRPAVFAYRANEEDFAKRWSGIGSGAGWRSLLRESYGWRLLGWKVLGVTQRRNLRRGNQLMRSMIGKAIGVTTGALR